jgi:hypothetical protein
VTTAIGAFGTFRLLPVVIAGLIKPFGVPFRVTPKGSANDQNYFDSYTFAALALLIVITTAGLIINLIPEWAVVLPGEFGVLADYWAVVNIVVLALAAMICFEVPRRAREDFVADEPVAIHAAGESIAGRVTRLSLGYVTIELPPGQALPPVLHTIELGGVQALPARIVRHSYLPDGGIRYTVVLNNLKPDRAKPRRNDREALHRQVFAQYPRHQRPAHRGRALEAGVRRSAGTRFASRPPHLTPPPYVATVMLWSCARASFAPARGAASSWRCRYWAHRRSDLSSTAPARSASPEFPSRLCAASSRASSRPRR